MSNQQECIFYKRNNRLKTSKGKSLRIAGAYFLVGCIWSVLSIFHTEIVLGGTSIGLVTRVAEDFLYMLVTSSLIFWLVNQTLKKKLALQEELLKANSSLEISNKELQRENQKRLESESIYRSFIDSSNDMTYLKDDQLRHVIVNRKMIEMLGVSEKGIIGKKDMESVPSEFMRLCQVNEEKVLSSGCMNISEETVGGKIYKVTRFPVEMKDNRIGVGGYFHDITKAKKDQKEINTERNRAQMYLDIAGIIFLALDKEGKVTMINDTGCKLVGLNKEEVLGKNWVEYFVLESEKESVKGLLKKMIEENQFDVSARIYENQIITCSGDKRVIAWNNVALRDDSGEINGIISSGIDITERKIVSQALNESERSKAVLLSHIPGIAFRCYYDREWTMQFLSDGCYKLTGYKPEAFIDNKELSYRDIISEEYQEAVWYEISRVLETKESFNHEYEIITASGERKWVMELGQYLFDDNGKVEALEGIIIDISESKHNFAKIQYMNEHDSLTNLYNRRYFEDAKVQMDTESNYPLCIVIADINGMRLINHTFGNDRGNWLINQTAKIIQSCCRPSDLLARTGGDEFSILLPNTDLDEANQIRLSIIKAIKEFNSSVQDEAFAISLSIGFGIKRTKASSIDEAEMEAETYLARRKLLEEKSHHSATLNSIMATLYARSNETEEHAQRLAMISRLIGEHMNLEQTCLDDLQLFSMLHDIGKIGVPDRVLNKPGRLTEKEWVVMRKHSEIGYNIAMTSPEFAVIANYILAHHERWDGSGYPRGLCGEEIPLLSRILAVADAYDAMTEDRVYRKALPKEVAIEEIRKNAGTQFDPHVVRIFMESIGVADHYN
ncbi:PAS domain S-box protein [Clostridia bacterium]|nr:PAS domain S-box protein [Clostridia bacterium]